MAVVRLIPWARCKSFGFRPVEFSESTGAGPVLGPGDVPLRDVEVRVKMLKELGAQNDFDPVITADIDGPNARAKRIDQRLAREAPALASVKPATRLATAILVYSFGGLKREGAKEDESQPPGVNESELLAACVGPDLDNITATAVLSELRNSCLYLHHDGVRYCFKKDPNVTKLIEDAEQEIAREETKGKTEAPVRAEVKKRLDARLCGHHEAEVWPSQSIDIPDEEPRFLVAYLPLEFGALSKTEQEQQARELLGKHGSKPRRYKNGVGLVVPDKRQIEALRRAVRYLLAIERVDSRKRQHRLTKDQQDQLKERNRTEEAACESAFRELYSAVWLPRMEGGELDLEKVERGGMALQATGVHERVMELLTGERNRRVHGTVTPRKIMERVKLGEPPGAGEQPIMGIRAADVQEAFFRDLVKPRLASSGVLRRGIARGVEEGLFAYTSGAVPTLGPDGKYQVNLDKVVFHRPILGDEVDFESGFLIVPLALPERPKPEEPGHGSPGPETPQPPGDGGDEEEPGPAPGPEDQRTSVRYVFHATRDKVFKAFPAIANLADRSDGGKVKIRVEGTSGDGYDPGWLRNAVDEPLDEADIERLQE